MKPTLEWMKMKFEYFNKKYFGNKLETPRFSLECRKGHWGYYSANNPYNVLTRNVELKDLGTIHLNGSVSRTESDLIGTLLHEMIHMYIMTVLKKYPKNQHGKEFVSIANVINKDGWNISEMNERKITDVDDNEESSTDINAANIEDLFCVIEKPQGKNYKFWGVKCKKDNLNNIIRLATQLKEHGATSMYVYTVQSDNFSKFPFTDNTLKGIGGMSITMIISALSSIIGERLTNKNFKLVKQQKL